MATRVSSAFHPEPPAHQLSAHGHQEWKGKENSFTTVLAGNSPSTDDFTTSLLHFSLFSAALWDWACSRPVHSLMSSSHLFFRLPCLLPPFTVPYKMGLVGPDERETCQMAGSSGHHKRVKSQQRHKQSFPVCVRLSCFAIIDRSSVHFWCGIGNWVLRNLHGDTSFVLLYLDQENTRCQGLQARMC